MSQVDAIAQARAADILDKDLEESTNDMLDAAYMFTDADNRNNIKILLWMAQYSKL